MLSVTTRLLKGLRRVTVLLAPAHGGVTAGSRMRKAAASMSAMCSGSGEGCATSVPARGNSTGCPGLQTCSGKFLYALRGTWEMPPVAALPGAEGLLSAAKH